MRIWSFRIWRIWEFQMNLERHNSHDENLQNHEDRLKQLEQEVFS